jgi:hypothetical protein
MFSYQLYSSRNFPPMSRTFEMVSKAGYSAVEGYGALYADDAAVRGDGRRAGGHRADDADRAFRPGQLETEVDKVLGIARALKMERLYVPLSDARGPARPTRRGGRRLARGCKRRARPTRRRATALAGTTTISSSSRCPMAAIPQDRIFEGGPGLEWEMDVAWVDPGRGGPAGLDRPAYKDRITAAHVKDIAPGGRERGRGRLVGRRPRHRGLEAILRRAAQDRGAAFRHGTRQPEGPRAVCNPLHRFGQSILRTRQMAPILGIGIIGAAISRPPICGWRPCSRGWSPRRCGPEHAEAARRARRRIRHVKAQSVDDLLANKDVDVVINLTIPDAHYAVTRSASWRRASTPIRKSRWS